MPFVFNLLDKPARLPFVPGVYLPCAWHLFALLQTSGQRPIILVHGQMTKEFGDSFRVDFEAASGKY